MSENNTPNVTETVAADAPEGKTTRSHRSHAVKEWWWMRITSAVLVPLSVWFLVALISRLLGADPTALANWIAHPLVLLAMVMLLCMGFIHTRLGLHEIITDYVHAPATKKATLLFVDLLIIGLAVGSIGAVLHLYRMA